MARVIAAIIRILTTPNIKRYTPLRLIMNNTLHAMPNAFVSRDILAKDMLLLKMEYIMAPNMYLSFRR